MAEASIALNRFGLGARPGDDPGSDPRRWLAVQFDRYEARPAAIAAVPTSATVVGEIADYIEQARAFRRELGPRAARQAKPAGAQMSPAAGAMSPEMDQAMRANAPAMQDMAKRKVRDLEDPVMAARRVTAKQARETYGAAVSARALTAINSPAPMVERLVHFWANHFAVSADKLETIGLSGTLEFEAIRPHVLGSFRDMLFAVERHPAMLVYLDQAQSVGPNSLAAQVAGKRQGPNAQRRFGLNENLAREIMELHTLGVRTVYTQTDVTEFARAMTGWSVSGLGRGQGARFAGTDGTPGNFVFAERLHEPGTRAILGKSWPQPGEDQASAVLDMLAAHPATARHIATKLARHFAGDDPPAPLVARLETTFLKSNGDLPSVYRALIAAPECWVLEPVKFKSPWEWTISALRGLGTQQLPPMAINALMTQLGQPVWKPSSPAGWDDVAGAWAGPDAILRRVEAAERMAQRTKDMIDARQRAAELFPGALSASTAQAIARAESPGQGVALMLSSPEFMRR
ncbi:DUF1800 domain-containing protein [Sphingomonas sp. JC676]|uniref:DUF1800 domain-containing protein n=1 Tax=Sphingomonas sp. JC676 TaxID=2768065 RepID=UPI001657EB9D|nr:DUF1800 domain-containing protein [Sphingomonas sp. JC676]MBC9032352.1 DUF1800 domain-containing protein [Sphingomonas sp. JC676]